ncbi:MAG: rubredoxin [Limnohabitans sp.]
MNTWMCVVCGFIYDEATGDPESPRDSRRLFGLSQAITVAA